MTQPRKGEVKLVHAKEEYIAAHLAQVSHWSNGDFTAICVGKDCFAEAHATTRGELLRKMTDQKHTKTEENR